MDRAAAHVGFTRKSRCGRTLVGHSPNYEGVVAALPDGRHQVRLRLYTATVEIEDSPTFTRLTRGDSFFEADRIEWVAFVYYQYPDALRREGGRLGGHTTLAGVERRASVVNRPAIIRAPGVDSDIVPTDRHK